MRALRLVLGGNADAVRGKEALALRAFDTGAQAGLTRPATVLHPPQYTPHPTPSSHTRLSHTRTRPFFFQAELVHTRAHFNKLLWVSPVFRQGMSSHIPDGLHLVWRNVFTRFWVHKILMRMSPEIAAVAQEYMRKCNYPARPALPLNTVHLFLPSHSLPPCS